MYLMKVKSKSIHFLLLIWDQITVYSGLSKVTLAAPLLESQSTPRPAEMGHRQGFRPVGHAQNPSTWVKELLTLSLRPSHHME